MIKDTTIDFRLAKPLTRRQFVKEVVTGLETIVFGGVIVLISNNFDDALSSNIVTIS
jgi:hypothetical protein